MLQPQIIADQAAQDILWTTSEKVTGIRFIISRMATLARGPRSSTKGWKKVVSQRMSSYRSLLLACQGTTLGVAPRNAFVHCMIIVYEKSAVAVALSGSGS